jgi:hypothetical protein
MVFLQGAFPAPRGAQRHRVIRGPGIASRSGSIT